MNKSVKNPLIPDQAANDEDDLQHCACGKILPFGQAHHVHRCSCGRIWLRPDCSEICAPWSEY
jgi:hypothetical protein